MRGIEGGRAAAIAAPATAARWDLHGLLAPLGDAELDADPGGGEWSVRLTLGHIVGSQRAYGWGTGWWLQAGYRIDDPALPRRSADDAFWAAIPDEATVECAGSIDDIRARLDAVTDLTAERLGALSDAQLALGSRWAGFAVPIAFRNARWSSHIREHTVQVEKTLAMLGRTPSEPERVVRVALAAYGRAESVVFAQPDADAAAGIIRDATREARDTIASARAAAMAGG